MDKGPYHGKASIIMAEHTKKKDGEAFIRFEHAIPW
jgi:hypothetical protein